MKVVFILEKRHRTLVSCIEALRRSPDRSAYQSELKRQVYSSSWRRVVRPALESVNQLVGRVLPGRTFVTLEVGRNPRTGRQNELLLRLPEYVEVVNEGRYYAVVVGGCAHDEC